MTEIQMTKKDFSSCLDYCILQRKHGSFRYINEISVPDNVYNDLIVWLEKCEKANLSFVFIVIERYEGFKLLYGFSNFEIKDFPLIKSFCFSFDNNDIMYDRFISWHKESSFLVLNTHLHNYFELIRRFSYSIE